MKFIFVTGGVLSGLGKGITASSIGKLLSARAISVTAIKIDPYLNCDAGTMNPYQHGEVFVLEDGGEVDLDLGNYERFLDIDLTSQQNITTGKVYRTVIEKERHGDYLGNTVQIIPHITNEIKEQIRLVAKNSGADVTLVEVGGTVGDIESMPFLEALRQLQMEVGGRENCIFVHTTLVPVVSVVNEQKTKPTQHSVKELRAIGIQPDIIVGRARERLTYDIKRKIAMFCDVPLNAVISAPDANTIYEVPLILEEEGISDLIMKKMKLEGAEKDMGEWDAFLNCLDNPENEVEIAVVGKYTNLVDSYISHKEALLHSGAKHRCRVKIRWIEAEHIEDPGEKLLGVHGIVIPGGFGSRGTVGKMKAITYARENKIPFLGICLGFQLSVIEFSRNVLGLENADSTEFNEETPYPVVDLLPEQKEIEDMGATMRLGANTIQVETGTKAFEVYQTQEISERHRHRYEINPNFINQVEARGLKFVGKSFEGVRMEIAELDGHPYFLASQFHPEFKSRPGRPAPLYSGLVASAIQYKIDKGG